LDYIEIEYNQELKPLESVLSRVKQPGDFFVCGVIEIPMPRVEVEGTGTLSFPVPDAQIASIVRRAERSPYAGARKQLSIRPCATYGRSLPGRSRSAENPGQRILRTSFRK
jgi:hypothetical protein